MAIVPTPGIDGKNHSFSLLSIPHRFYFIRFSMQSANGPSFPDPFRHERGLARNFVHAILATALFRCWHILLFFAAWSTVISVISHTTKDLGIPSTLLTVFVGKFFCIDITLTYSRNLQPWYYSRFCDFVQNYVQLREIQ
jgi:hypothetical protein